ncbi:YcaO-like family protein [Streptomyces sp. NBC_01795]|uniref:YcaO-like family protein n=1 Tax=unclassified Streptomyces TaxID=2593676 RepID=UPI002DDBF234|nr:MULTISPECIES: YcaO-like family protein [unclassified Streptomyces]WSA95876.1 YcaO-like family protein [Streptomyces sp. NBC_01795]WSS11498.1 YcaO-like family protein [Streptomyces sp. NBC_01186]
MKKVFFTGTHRVRTPEETYALLAPLLREFGITRLADVTGLDTLGIPVVMSVRPLAFTLSVSQGKGVSLPLAKVSAAMEAIELWHAEHAVPPPTVRDASAAALDLPYDVATLAWPVRHLITGRTRLDWIEAQALPGGGTVPLPRAAVHLGPAPDTWHVPGLAADSNGLASGNTLAEATVHALYEVFERDSLAGFGEVPDPERRYIDPLTVDDEHCATLISRILSAGCFLELTEISGRPGAEVACMRARLWHEDLASTLVRGTGAHADPAIALSRALTEAVQSRLTQIVGARDDITPAVYRTEQFARPSAPGRTQRWEDILSAYPRRLYATDTAETDWLAAHMRELTGQSPLRVVLAERTELAVVKIVCPTLRHIPSHRGAPAR